MVKGRVVEKAHEGKATTNPLSYPSRASPRLERGRESLRARCETKTRDQLKVEDCREKGNALEVVLFDLQP